MHSGKVRRFAGSTLNGRCPHVDRVAWTIGLEELNVENLLHLFIDPRHMPFMVSDDMVWPPVCRLCLLRDVGGVPLARATDSESNSHPF